MSFERDIAAIARRQHGVVSLTDVRSVGGSLQMAKVRVRAGTWTRLRRGVYAIAGHPLTWEANVLADVLAAPDGTLASHRSAAHLWDLDGSEQGRPEVSVPRTRRPVGLRGIAHCSTDLELAEPVRRRGIPTTGIHRTLLDVSIRVSPERFEHLVDSALRRRLVAWPDLYSTLVHHSRRGRDGCGTFRAFLDRRWGDKAVPDSVFERKVVRLIDTAGLPAPALQHVVPDVGGRDIRIDLAWPDQLVAVELQSKRWHLNTESFDRDKERANRLRHRGWKVYEYTWRHYCDAADEIVEQLRAVLERRLDRSCAS